MIPFDGAKLAIYAGAAIVVGVLAYKAYDAIGDSREAEVRAEMQALVDAEKAKVEAAEDRADKITEDKDRERLSETQALQSRIDGLLSQPRVGVRLCEPAPRRTAETGISPSAVDAAASATGEGSDMRAGRDIEPELLHFAQRCETDRQTVIAWQSWYRDQSAAWGL